MSDKPRLVNARNTLTSLCTWLYSDDLANKYFIKNENGEFRLKNPPATLDEKDIETVADYIIKALNQSKGSLSKGNILKFFNDDELVLKYIKGIISNVGFRTKDFSKFINKLKLPETKPDPVSITDEENINNPNILTNLAYYVSNTEQPIKLYDKLPTSPELTKITKDESDKKYQKQQQDSDQKIGQLESDVKQKGDIIERGKKIVNDLQDENTNLKGKLTDAQILRNEVDEVKTDIKQLLKKNKSDILNDVALRLAGDPDLKKNIRKIKGDLKAANPTYSDGDINYIISKALSENERYLKTVAANPDLFDRDMSNDTIQKENEQFQSKLRQQNLRYILPKFIERREKLVENTLNPNLLKGAFAI